MIAEYLLAAWTAFAAGVAAAPLTFCLFSAGLICTSRAGYIIADHREGWRAAIWLCAAAVFIGVMAAL